MVVRNSWVVLYSVLRPPRSAVATAHHYQHDFVAQSSLPRKTAQEVGVTEMKCRKGNRWIHSFSRVDSTLGPGCQVCARKDSEMSESTCAYGLETLQMEASLLDSQGQIVKYSPPIYGYIIRERFASMTASPGDPVPTDANVAIASSTMCLVDR